LIKTFGFEFVPYDYANEKTRHGEAVGWIRDNVPHLDVSVEESNQRLDILEIFKESESSVYLYTALRQDLKEWDTITHPMNPDGWAPKTNADSRNLCTVEKHVAL
jgi:hypothetical protein